MKHEHTSERAAAPAGGDSTVPVPAVAGGGTGRRKNTGQRRGGNGTKRVEPSGAKHAAPDGLVIVDKPAGFTSHDVVAKMRGMARTRRVGHAGTLDPMATGVLVLGIERATKLLGHLALTEKEYVGTIRLGQTTVTDDAEGEITASKAAHGIAREDIDAGIAGLSGAIMQIPSKVSAIKIDGKRSYSRVRDGEDVEIPARPVTVSSFVLHSAHETEAADGTPVTDLLVSVECSSGTYIRALARDLGEGLGVGGHLTALRRTRVGPYKLDRARTLEQFQAAVNGGEGAEGGEGTGLPVMPIGDAAAAAFVRWDVTQAQARLLANGVRIAMPLFDSTDGSVGADGAGTGGRVGGPVAVFGPDGTFLALVENQGGKAKSLAVFV
ncbi:tRNA pseudouridine(55) synthase TruB [Streptomyces celluloflavus]|uniref:tRNA pseudouridine(55) synthase TruB n=1 Tax=Streptomyces celluloflavus TaxID=58344 RepID=UPI0036B79550